MSIKNLNVILIFLFSALCMSSCGGNEFVNHATKTNESISDDSENTSNKSFNSHKFFDSQNQVVVLQNEIDQLKKNNSLLKSNVPTNKQKINNLTHKNDEILEKLDNEKLKINQLEGDIEVKNNELNKNIQNNSSMLDLSKEEIEENKKKISDLNQNLNQIELGNSKKKASLEIPLEKLDQTKIERDNIIRDKKILTSYFLNCNNIERDYFNETSNNNSDISIFNSVQNARNILNLSPKDLKSINIDQDSIIKQMISEKKLKEILSKNFEGLEIWNQKTENLNNKIVYSYRFTCDACDNLEYKNPSYIIDKCGPLNFVVSYLDEKKQNLKAIISIDGFSRVYNKKRQPLAIDFKKLKIIFKRFNKADMKLKVV